MHCSAFDPLPQLGDCWLLAALASLAEYPDAIRNVRRRKICLLPVQGAGRTRIVSHSCPIASASCKMRPTPAANTACACGTVAVKSAFLSSWLNGAEHIRGGPLALLAHTSTPPLFPHLLQDGGTSALTTTFPYRLELPAPTSATRRWDCRRCGGFQLLRECILPHIAAFPPSSQGFELWALLLEKAFAKFCGGYAYLDGGRSPWAWHTLTGDNVFR